MSARTTFALLLLTVPAVAAPVPKALKAKPVSLDGTWELVEMVAAGQDVTRANPLVWEIAGEALTQSEWREGRLAVTDPGTRRTLARPPGGGAGELDYRCQTGGAAKTYDVAFALAGDELVVCIPFRTGQPRPGELKAAKDITYCRFKRATDAPR